MDILCEYLNEKNYPLCKFDRHIMYFVTWLNDVRAYSNNHCNNFVYQLVGYN
jgi:hypothetical protein